MRGLDGERPRLGSVAKPRHGRARRRDGLVAPTNGVRDGVQLDDTRSRPRLSPRFGQDVLASRLEWRSRSRSLQPLASVGPETAMLEGGQNLRLTAAGAAHDEHAPMALVHGERWLPV